MSPVVRRALRFQDLLAIQGGDGPYVFTRMFRESDRGEIRQSWRHFKLLKHVDGTVRDIVEAPEKVVFITEGRGFAFWEQWVLGWRRAVVLTGSRAIFLQLDARRRPRPLHRQLAYGAIVRINEDRPGRVEVETRGGDTLELRGLRRVDRALVTEALRSGAKAEGDARAVSGIERLCPHCHTGLSGRPRACPRCLKRFRSAWLSAFFSLMIPGLGNHLMGFRGFAVLELLTAVSIWAAYLFGPEMWGMSGVRSALHPGWIFGVVHGADAVLTWSVARSGVFLAGRN